MREEAWEVQYELRNVTSKFSEVSLPTVGLHRNGGPNAADLAFRSQVFEVIGSVTAAGGQVEAALKRLLVLVLVRSDVKASFALADHEWKKLEDLLQDKCSPPNLNAQRTAIRDAIQWADRRKLRERRNDAVHGAWWLYAGVGVQVARWPRRKDSRMIVERTLDPWQQAAEDCWTYADRLNEIVGNDWPQAVLPQDLSASD